MLIEWADPARNFVTESGPTTSARDGRTWVERNRFGRIGRLPTPTPFPVGDVNAYLILPAQGSEQLTLIDTGVKTNDAFDAIRRGFKEYGFSLEQLTRILVTHAHMDHFGQAKRLRDLSGATIYASAIEAERMRTGWNPTADRADDVLRTFRRWGVPEEIARNDGGMAAVARVLQEAVDVDVVLAEGDRVEAGDLVLEVIETPGHCEGHIVFYERDTRTLFSGDHLLPDISPVPLLAFPRADGEPRPRSLIRFLRSLERVEELDCAITFPSHGDVIHDHRALIASYRLHHDKRSLQLERMLAAGPRTPFEIAAKMFPRAITGQIMLVMSEVIGHLDVLEARGVIAIEPRGDVDQAVLLGPGAAAAG